MAQCTLYSPAAQTCADRPNEIRADIEPTVKRRNKQRQIAEQKAKKAAAAPPAPAPKRKQNNEEDEAKLDPRMYFEIRSRAIKKLKQTRQPDPYPHKFHVTTDMRQFVKEYTSLKTGEERKDVEVRVGARIYGKVSLHRSYMWVIILTKRTAREWQQSDVLCRPRTRDQNAGYVSVEQRQQRRRVPRTA